MTFEQQRFYRSCLQNQKRIIRLLTMIDGKLRQIKRIQRTLIHIDDEVQDNNDKVSIISETDQDQQNRDADEEMVHQEVPNSHLPLSNGCLSRIGSGTVFGPRLQILGYEKIESQQTQEFLDPERYYPDRYRISLSDSEYYNNSFDLDPKLNHMIEDKLLEKNTIVCLTDFTIRHSINRLEGEENHAIRINSIDVIESGRNVGQEIGNPVKIRASSICSFKAQEPDLAKPN